MNRNFVFNHQDRPSAWSRTASTLNRWLWGALCCGVPGVPCYFCTCCERLEDGGPERERPRVNQSTATADRMVRPHRPHAPRGRKHTPETLSAVRCALTQLQGEPGVPSPTVPPEYSRHSPEPG
ncbi:unnamed protein product [Spodoptera littoralis]|uniref:Uncharacterized protein n=3 Tax=Spodoptera TaxID=7106 RepID=A0A9P0IG63_SPOLI|nr:uncharacterized protein LOC111352130 [Spodoptera litura]XP_035436849.1 uncharacterized protein LOC118267145 [Spodoptera frugiperda]CAH1646290.1 unnamed protein product [Spodoptera littoralis]